MLQWHPANWTHFPAAKPKFEWIADSHIQWVTDNAVDNHIPAASIIDIANWQTETGLIGSTVLLQAASSVSLVRIVFYSP